MAVNAKEQRDASRTRMTFDPDDPFYIKDLQRPAVIKEDLFEMERRKRVQQLLESKSFCRELEDIVRQESDSTRDEALRMKTLQKLSELTISQCSPSLSSLLTSTGHTLLIADWKSNDAQSKHERAARNKLASLCRLVDLFQWSLAINNHVSVRLPHESNHFLINPFGLLFHEITASSFVKKDVEGRTIDSGSTKFQANSECASLHAEIYASRPDVGCILHLHTAVVSAVASMKCGLLPLCQQAMLLGPVSYHDSQDGMSEVEERRRIIEDLGDRHIVVLRSALAGYLIAASTVESALHFAQNIVCACETQILLHTKNGSALVVNSNAEAVAICVSHLVAACEHQVRAARAGIDNLVIPDKKTIERAQRRQRNDRDSNGLLAAAKSHSMYDCSSSNDWSLGELEWEAWMRMLDHAGYRTGHVYRQPLVRPKSSMSQSTVINNEDIATPPAATAVGLVNENELDSAAAYRLSLLRKEQERIRWLNSPNAYQKVEFLETGTDKPKKITKWVQDITQQAVCSTPIKIASPHHFNPASVDPKEFKNKQQAIKDNRQHGALSAGPQSVLLEGITYQDIAAGRPDSDGIVGPSDRGILIGTASKGIIDRQFQHNAQVYGQLYAPNPFSTETDESIRIYMQEVEQKSPSTKKSADSKSTRQIIIYDENPEADTVSLMQGVREHRLSMSRRSASNECLDGFEDPGLSPQSARNGKSSSRSAATVPNLPAAESERTELLPIMSQSTGSSKSRTIALESRTKLPQKLQDIIIDASLIQQYAASASGSSEMLQSSAKQMAALDPIMDSIQTTLRGFETIANEIESDITTVERKMNRIGDVQEGLQKLENSCYCTKQDVTAASSQKT
ncbi:hypothetical protein WR25_00180 [Diploscapter pachys]|uniref:BLOC-1-related complex subunit 7 n=1 Tax=Diploscapter pachys TaxID=2018661 RepID=A0A2A2JLK7_9BILA|nr:hypothetical protein WR25_00180 [Diploscapter pachys]